MLKQKLSIYILIIVAILHPALAKEFKSIFDGKSLNGWDGDPQYWKVQNGEIIGHTSAKNPLKENTFLIWKGSELKDFELKVEFKLINHNSGIQIRSQRLPGSTWGMRGYQADIDASGNFMGAAWGEKHKQVLAHRGEITEVGATPNDLKVRALTGDSNEILTHIKSKDWNEYHIIAYGNQIILKINGIVTCQFSEVTEDRLKSGLIGLQLHSGEPMQVHFRNIRLRELDSQDKKKVLFLAGEKSHGPGAHECKAGAHLLARCFHESNLDIVAHVADEGKWPEAWAEFDKPNTVVMYCDGGPRHVAKSHQKHIQDLVNQGVGVVCLHYAVEVDKNSDLSGKFLDWIGGYFESGFSVNPFWTPVFQELPEHPISRGVKPFSIHDEWYYHMRFRPDMKNITPILQDLPPLETLTDRPQNNPRANNPDVLKSVQNGEKQTLAWAYVRPDGGRGFGFTGGHHHKNWLNEDFRKLVLNAIAWSSHLEIPASGMVSRTPSQHEISLNFETKKPKK